MPKAAPLQDALAKKGGLTLSQLVDYDDRLTDALVDRVSIHCHHIISIVLTDTRSTIGRPFANYDPDFTRSEAFERRMSAALSRMRWCSGKTPYPLYRSCLSCPV